MIIIIHKYIKAKVNCYKTEYHKMLQAVKSNSSVRKFCLYKAQDWIINKLIKPNLYSFWIVTKVWASLPFSTKLNIDITFVANIVF